MNVIFFIAIVATVVATFALTLTDRRFGFALLLALLPTYTIRFSLPLPGVGALPSTLLEFLFFVVFLGWLLTDARRHAPLTRLRPWLRPIILFVTGSIIGILVAPDLRAALGLWRAYVLEPLLFFVMAADILRDQSARRYALTALAATTALIGVVAIIQKFTGLGIANPFWRDAATRRITAWYGYPNAVGLFVAPLVVLFIGTAIASLRERSAAAIRTATFFFIAAGLGITAAFFAVSEGALLGIIAGLAAFGLLEKKFRIPALVAIIVGSIAIATIPPLTSYATGILSLSDDSGHVRRIVWSDAAAMLHEHPVFGAGLAGYPARVAPYHTAVGIELFQYPHNLILNFWSETGLIGLAGFLAIITVFFIQARRLRRDPAQAWLADAAMVTLLVHGLVDVPYFKNDLALLFWTIIALIESARSSTETKMTPTASRS